MKSDSLPRTVLYSLQSILYPFPYLILPALLGSRENRNYFPVSQGRELKLSRLGLQTDGWECQDENPVLPSLVPELFCTDNVVLNSHNAELNYTKAPLEIAFQSHNSCWVITK